MNRDVEFKAWDKINKGWCFYTNADCMRYLKDENVHIIEYTCCKDKNGKGNKVFEGDIFEIVFADFGTNLIIVFGKVVFIFGGFHVEFIHPKTKKLSYVLLHELLKNPDKEIKGNIFENPDLIS